MNYDIEAIATSHGFKRPSDSEIYQYQPVPHGTICPRCKESVVESDRVCDSCKQTIDSDDFGTVDVEEHWEDNGSPGAERLVLYLRNGETVLL